jgi:hypothetical protein
MQASMNIPGGIQKARLGFSKANLTFSFDSLKKRKSASNQNSRLHNT